MPNESLKEFKVYSFILETGTTIFLSIQYSSSLEEAFGQAKLEFEKVNGNSKIFAKNMIGSKIGLFTVKSIEELIKENTSFDQWKIEQIKKEKET